MARLLREVSPKSKGQGVDRSGQNTLRWPTSEAPNARNNFGEMSNQINTQFRGFQAQVYKMLLNCKTYNCKTPA